MTALTLQQLLDAIAALSEAERQDLLARVRALYPAPPTEAPASPPPQPGRGEWLGPVDFLIVFDGGSRGNPGPGYGSYAVFDALGSGEPVRLTFDGALTNNEAEYHTLLAALRDLSARLGPAAPHATVKVLGDSLLVINQVKGEWQAREPRLRALRDEAVGLLRGFRAHRLAYQPRADTVQVLGH